MRIRSHLPLLLALVVPLVGCGSEEQKPAPKAQAARQGERLLLNPATISDMKAVGAEITTQDMAEATVRIPGLLQSLTVREGDMVKKGQRIGMVVDNRLGYESAAFGAQIAAAQAEASRAQAELGRIRYLYQQNVYAKARLEQAEAAARAANAQVAAARAQQGAVSSVAGQGAIIAPASGRVLRADVPQGSAVAPGVSVATITAGAPIVRLDLPESLVGKVRTGARIVLADPDNPSGSLEGQVVQVYPAIAGGRVRVDATVSGLAATSVGRRVSATVEVGQRSAIVVPRKFVSTRYGMDYVEVVAKDGALTTVPVQIAPAAETDKVEILSGVGAGDTIYTAGGAK
ncbi:efflux RND transporter periplasmic adaptor subunit [Sphingorhabdus sp.]|jgi:RND family efflux transporter MFP subunit|uniref:efflux RND transporter periplasmic adaptor subunit n=1 Tax=Sphingorhabdus sp. TaxID=1902408 RepID=UPI003BAF201B|nr:efflux RND transporter periplasmic adaptor subunit [Sphingomonadales bacterium]MBK9433321.1 efflux RND transporter periplasmic adaptor subunit [Sphingomonadales bacterium]MBL0022633.1 efflux RND transporter periplasmic adaptor subunit [Sphingomonadales bacterium]